MIVKTGYICEIAYDHELEYTDVKIYYSIATLKEHTKCWQECGIVEVEIKKIAKMM